MTYPKVSTTGEHTGAAFGVPASPRFPQIEEAVLAHWEADDTFRASVENRSPGRARRERVRLLRRPALRQRPAALRPPADRLRQGRRAALPDDARPPGRAALRLGHPRAARRARGDAPQRHQDHRRDPRAGHREVQRGLPRVGDEVHRRVARLRHPPGPLGRLRQRLQHDEPRLHGVGHLGVQVALRQGLRLRGLPRPALLLERRDARCPTTSCGWTTRSTRTARTPRSPSGTSSPTRAPTRSSTVPTSSSGRRRRGPCRRTSPSWSGPTSTTSSSRRPSPAPTARRATSSPRRGCPPTRASSASAEGEFTVVGRYKGADLVGRTYTPPFSYYAGHENAFRVVAADDAVTTTDGTGVVHTAGAFGEVDKEVTDREGIEAVMPVGKSGRFTVPVADYEGVQVFDANAMIIDHLQGAPRARGAPAR